MQVNIYTAAGLSRTGDKAVARAADGLAQKSWPSAMAVGSAEPVVSPGVGVNAAFFAGSGGGVWAVPDGPTTATATSVSDGDAERSPAAPGHRPQRGIVPPGWSFLELFLRGDAAAAASASVSWPTGATAPLLRSLIREARVNGWEGITDEHRAVTLPSVPSAAPPLPVDAWVGGYPGPSEAAAGAGTATVVAWVDAWEGEEWGGGADGGSGGDDGEGVHGGGDGDSGGGGGGRRLVTWTVEGVRWAPAGGGRHGGSSRVVALEDGLYLSTMADVREGGVVEFGRATPPPWGGGARQRLLVVMTPGGAIDRVVHESYPPPGGEAH